MNTRTQRGFTLWELMLAVAVAGVVLGLGVPSFQEFQRNNAMAAAANDLLTGLLLARAEAVKRQVPVTFCATPDPSAANPECGTSGASGYIVFVDDDGDDVVEATDGNAEVDTGETVLLRHDGPGGTIHGWADSSYVLYRPNGFTQQPAAQTTPPATRILFCDDRGNRVAAGGTSAARVIWIDPTGRAVVRQDVDLITDAANDLDADCS
jgi:type IV fimbrial biogenesis protein FimT